MSAISLYARHTAGFEARLAAAVQTLRDVCTAHGGIDGDAPTSKIVQSTSLGVEDMVVTDLIMRHHLPISLSTLDTGMLHAETLALIGRMEQHYGLQVAVYRPQTEAVISFVKTHGDKAMYESIDLRKACCGLRKMEPLGRMLAGRSAWVTGLRREQSNARGEVAAVETDDNGRAKINPLVDWSWQDVWHYVALHNVPFNPLHDEFMPSIGCAPCTRAIGVGEDFRAGRWWWEDEAAKECGLHVSQAPQTSPLRAV